jgi:hypothetical protein
MEGSRERGCSRSGSPDAENAHFGKLGVRREGRRHRGRKPRPAANPCTGPEGHAGWNFGFNARFISEAEWNATVNVNLTAVFNLTQAVLEDMIARKEGTIITVLFAGGRQSEPARWGRLRCSQGRCEEFHDLPAQHLS